MEFDETPREPFSAKSDSFSEESENRMVSFSGLRRRTDSQLSDSSQQTSTPSLRRVSVAAGAQRRFSRSISTYISPYSKWKPPPSSVEEKSTENEKRTMENTYRMEPKVKLPEMKIRNIIQHTLTSALETETYNGNSFGYLTKLLSARILAQVKDLNIERYKLVCFVNIGSQQRQGLHVASRCLWNPDVDTVVSASFENSSIFAVASVYGIYFE